MVNSLIKVDGFQFNTFLKPFEINHKTPILFLHGFTGDLEDWKFLVNHLPDNFTPILLDILGHGRSSSPSDPTLYSFDSQVGLLKKILDQIGIRKLVIAGYSMGGRLAISFSEKYPEMITAAIFESTSFGIESETARRERVERDFELAESLGKMNMEEFIDNWIKMPLFENLKKMSAFEYDEFRRKKIKSNSKIGLMNSLIGFSTGLMQYYIPHLKKFSFKVLLIAGERDRKFYDISIKAAEQFPDCDLKVIRNAGHNVHFEKPNEFLKLINDFLKIL